jgi:hypothetical protein
MCSGMEHFLEVPDFTISVEDMETLKHIDEIAHGQLLKNEQVGEIAIAEYASMRIPCSCAKPINS